MITWALLAGCGQPEPEPIVAPPLDPATASVDPVGEVELPQAAGPSRPFRRMDVGQLDASIRAVTGGIGWDDGDDSQLQELAATLGVPDYLGTTHEDLEPSLLFLKFLDDAANEVCDELLERESDLGPGNVFLVDVTLLDTVENHREAIEANLSRALLRFHGRSLQPGEAGLEPWVWLFESAAHVTGSTSDAWRTVCVGLLTHPDFYTY